MTFRSSSLALAALASTAIACGSSSTQTSSTGDGGISFHPGDSGVTFSIGSTGTTTITSNSSTIVETSTSSSNQTTVSTATSSSTASVVPSSGVVITVIPDGTDIAQGLLTAIENAKVSVHMEMYLLSNSTYITTLESLASKIDVKVVLNKTFPTGTAAAQTNASSYATLQGKGLNVKWAPANPDGSSSGYTHEKAVIIDPGTSNEQVWIMTMNLDTDAPKYNREYLAQDTNSADIAEAEQIFEADYAGTSATVSGNLVVAPVNAEEKLLNLVESATSTIDMEAEEIDESGQELDIYNALVKQAKNGVKVRLVLEDSTETSQATTVTGLQAAGVKVVGYVYGGTALDIHAKTLVVDGTSAYVGSENFTGGSLGYNREVGVIFAEASEVAKITAAIDADFAGGSTYSSQ